MDSLHLALFLLLAAAMTLAHFNWLRWHEATQRVGRTLACWNASEGIRRNAAKLEAKCGG